MHNRLEWQKSKLERKIDCKSCNDEVFREMYDDFAEWSSDESERSAISFPPNAKTKDLLY